MPMNILTAHDKKSENSSIPTSNHIEDFVHKLNNDACDENMTKNNIMLHLILVVTIL